MKRICVLLVAFILATGFVFAQENGEELELTQEPETRRERSIELFNMEISVSFPIHWTNGLHNDEFYRMINEISEEHMMEDKSVTANTAIGLGLIFNFTRAFGWMLDFDFFYGAKLTGFASPTSDYIGMSGANVFFGPVFYIFNNNVLRLPLSVGAHMYYFTDDLWIPQLDGSTGMWMNRHDLQFGPMVSLGVQFHFSRDIYMFSRTGVAIDLFRTHRIKWYDGHGNAHEFLDDTHRHFNEISINWLVKPSLGLGIKY